jgi:asparagine synthase (glutamine-hydrolysing)
MRGGFVACLAASGSSASRLESVAAYLKWHAGKPSVHRHGALQIACLADDIHGPMIETSGSRLLLCHGGPPEQLELLKRHDRFVGIESDGTTLRAIRDPMGEVPLFYRRVDDEFWLATEIHPLLAIAPAEPDLEWVAAFIAAVEHPDTTGWAGVARVLPGEILEVDGRLESSSRRYFAPGVGPRRGGPTPADAARRFTELFSNAVAKRSSERCGVLLSGGLDSSAVAVVAARATRPTLLTITHPGQPEVDETSYAEATSAATGLPLTTVAVDPEPWDPADDIRTFGAPPVGFPTGMYPLGLRALAAEGCEVALDGHDGDGALGNLYAWAANTLLDGRPDRLIGAAREWGARAILRETVKDFIPPSALRRLRRRPSSPAPGDTVLYFRGATGARLAERASWRPPRSGWEELQLQALLPPTTQAFEEMELLGARSGIDVQHPFADRELIDFLIALPHAVKLSTAHRKPLLRDGLADLLPRSVAERPDKTAFTAVVDSRVDYDACYRWVRDSGVRLEDVDYGRLFRDATKPVNDRLLWTRLASAHVFLAGCRR